MSKNNRWRIGLISDLHGNLIALQAALDALNGVGVDQFLCLGDVATSGPNPKETVALLRDLKCPVVMGNTDAWALDPKPFQYRNEDTPIIYDIELWGAKQLDENARHFLHSFAPTIRLELGSTTLLCYHGSPRSYLENIRATTSDGELETIFANQSATIATGGHTHAQMIRRYCEMMIVNPGSVGAPIAFTRGQAQAYYPPWAEFGILEIEDAPQGTTLRVELHRTPIDVGAVVAAALASGMPHVEWYLAHWRRDRARG